MDLQKDEVVEARLLPRSPLVKEVVNMPIDQLEAGLLLVYKEREGVVPSDPENQEIASRNLELLREVFSRMDDPENGDYREMNRIHTELRKKVMRAHEGDLPKSFHGEGRFPKLPSQQRRR